MFEWLEMIWGWVKQDQLVLDLHLLKEKIQTQDLLIYLLIHEIAEEEIFIKTEDQMTERLLILKMTEVVVETIEEYSW